jgi:hypothetical protein
MPWFAGVRQRVVAFATACHVPAHSFGVLYGVVVGRNTVSSSGARRRIAARGWATGGNDGVDADEAVFLPNGRPPHDSFRRGTAIKSRLPRQESQSLRLESQRRRPPEVRPERRSVLKLTEANTRQGAIFPDDSSTKSIHLVAPEMRADAGGTFPPTSSGASRSGLRTAVAAMKILSVRVVVHLLFDAYLSIWSERILLECGATPVSWGLVRHHVSRSRKAWSLRP